MNSNNQQGPRIPVRPAPPPPTNKQSASSLPSNKQEGNANSRRTGGINITKLLPSIIKKPASSQRSVTAGKKAPPPRPPPPKFAPKKPMIDLLSGSPPSSPSPTLRSQESGFEEDPELWRGWSDSSRSTPLLDWPSESISQVTEWPIESAAAPAVSSQSEPVTPQQWATPGAPQQINMPRPQTMPTIIRPGASRSRTVHRHQEEEEHSPPMPNFPPPAPPPELLEEPVGESWQTVALYDFSATHPDDLTLKAGDQVEVLSQVDENWLLGRVGDLIGHFPACFVQEQP